MAIGAFSKAAPMIPDVFMGGMFFGVLRVDRIWQNRKILINNLHSLRKVRLLYQDDAQVSEISDLLGTASS